MQIINNWPEQLALPESIKAALINHISKPFQTLAEAKAYRLESGTKLVIAEVPDDAIPEYTDPLPDGYTISLVITSVSISVENFPPVSVQKFPHGLAG